MKRLTSSKTFWLAVLQALACIVTAINTELPTIAYIGTIKSLLDIWLRMYTSKEIV